MTKEDFAREIENIYVNNDSVIKITFKNNKMVYGGFKIFDDYEVLKKQYKFRFVPSDKRKDYNTAIREQGKPEPAYSVIIDCTEIAKIQFVV